MKNIKGNILNVPSGVIVHQANCRGVMGAGLALQLRKRWPQIFTDYSDRFVHYGLELGEVVVTEVGNGLFVASLCGQKYYGRKRMRYTDYNAVRAGLLSIKALETTPIYIPFKMGSGLAGGDWPTILKIINEVVPETIIVRLG